MFGAIALIAALVMLFHPSVLLVVVYFWWISLPVFLACIAIDYWTRRSSGGGW